MSKNTYTIGDRVRLHTAGGHLVCFGDEPARFRITAVDKVPRVGIWYRLEAKRELLQEIYGGWYPRARISPVTPTTPELAIRPVLLHRTPVSKPKLAAQSALPHHLPTQALLVARGGAMSPMPWSPALQGHVIKAQFGDAFAASPAGEDAWCLARFVPLHQGAPHNEAACGILAALAGNTPGCGSPIGHIHGPALFVGHQRADRRYDPLPSSALAAIRRIVS
ncbi:hypothetical protein AB0H73_23505 [Streptomyces olivoreticuli]